MTFAELRADFERWARDNFSVAQVQGGDYDEAGYPGWQPVEDLFARHVATGSARILSEEDLRGLLFLIARAWDVGRIIAWLSTSARFSNIADLSEHDTLFLAEASLRFTGSEYDGARQQLAKVLDRVQTGRDAAISVLERLYESDDEYTKRMALLSLGSLDYPHIVVLLRRSWEMPDEYQRMACLGVLASRVHDDSLLDEFLHAAAGLPGPHLAKMRCDLLAERQAAPSAP